jgi:hypothetical protein
MKLVAGSVIDGKVVFDGEALPEGLRVVVVAASDLHHFDLVPEEEDELLERIREANLGRLLDVQHSLRDLGGKT